MRGWDGSVAEILVFPINISATRLKIFRFEHSILVTDKIRLGKVKLVNWAHMNRPKKDLYSFFVKVQSKTLWHNALLIWLKQKTSAVPGQLESVLNVKGQEKARRTCTT